MSFPSRLACLMSCRHQALLLLLVGSFLFSACDSGGPESPADSDPDPDNAEPSVTLQADPPEGADTLETTITVDGSDPDGEILTYKLDSDGDGGFEISQGSPIDTTLTYAKETTVEGAVEDDAGATAQETVTIEVEDQTPPSVTTSASEPDDNYGFVEGSAESNEEGTLTMYLVNGSDSTEVASQSNATTLEADIEAAGLLGYAVGDTATISVTAEDQAGNVAHAKANALIDGTDLDVTTYKASAEPGEGLVPYPAILAVRGEKVGEADMNGEAHVENLSVGDTLRANDELEEGSIGDLYRTNTAVEEKQNQAVEIGMLPNIELAEGDTTYANSWDLIKDAQGAGEDTPAGLQVRLRLPPNNRTPADGQTVDEIYPMSFAINENGKGLPQEHRQAIIDGIKSWNGADGQYDNVNVIDDTTKADWTIRIVDFGTRTNFEKGVVKINKPSDITPVSTTERKGAHEPYHALELGPTNSGHLDTPLYIGSTDSGTEATTTEVQALETLKNMRRLYDNGTRLGHLIDAE